MGYIPSAGKDFEKALSLNKDNPKLPSDYRVLLCETGENISVAYSLVPYIPFSR
jgi:Tfp pilus assembly protein PilF